MKQLAPKILEDAQFVKENLPGNELKIVELDAGASGLDAEASLSNLLLLTDELVRIYKDEDLSKYFPHAADSEIQGTLSSVRVNFTEFVAASSQAPVLSLLSNADLLYAICLRYGIVTFGFDQNEWKSIFHEILARRNTLHQTAREAENNAKKVKISLDEVTEATNKIEQFVAKSQENEAVVVASAENARIALGELREKAQTAEEILVKANVMLASIQEARAKSKDELEEIIKFYSEIEENKGKMTAVKSEADAKFNELREKHQSATSEFENVTKDIIDRNRELQSDIKDKLQKSCWNLPI